MSKHRFMNSQEVIELRGLLKSKKLKGISMLMEAYKAYKAYKANYLRNMVFDPSTPGLSMCLY